MFIVKGISSDDMGVVVEEEDFFKKSSISYEEISVAGVNGSVYAANGSRKDVISSFNIFLLRDNIDDVMSWLDGEGIFEFNGRAVEMLIYEQVEPLRSSNIKTATINYIRRPIWSDANDYYLPCYGTVQNRGNTVSYPIIHLIGSGKVDISIGSIRFQYEFKNDREVYIDCMEKRETLNGIRKGRNITIGFEYPFLQAGTTVVTIHSGTCEIYFKRRNAWL